MPKTIDITKVSNADSPLYRWFFEKLSAGSEIGIHTTIGNADVISNGFVVAIEGPQIWVELPRVTRCPRGLWSVPKSRIDIGQTSAQPVRKGTLKRGAAINVFEVYPNGMSVRVAGTVDGLIADAFGVGDHWFAYGSTEHQGKHRNLTVIGGR